MSSREDLLDWNEGVRAYDAGDYRGAIAAFDKITGSVGARIYFNKGMAFGAMNQPKEAIDCFTSAVRADKFLAVAYFMRGFFQIQVRGYGKALQDFDNAANYMRGNALIDYKQLGLEFRLYYAEVMFNRGMVQFLMGLNENAFDDLALASQAKMERSHDMIDQVLRSKRFDQPFSCPKNCLFRPPEQKLKNAQKVDYIKRDGARVVATTDAQDQYIGFKDAQIRREMREGRGGMQDEMMSTSPPPRSGFNSAEPPQRSGYNSEPPPSRSATGYSSRPAPPPPSSSGSSYTPPSSRGPTPSTGSYASSNGFSRPSSSSSMISSSSTIAPSSASISGGNGGKIKVKCHYRDTRIVLIEPDIDVGEFMQRVRDKFDGANLVIKYKDEDGDMIIMTDQEDLAMAMACSDGGKMDVWCSDN